MRIHWIWLSHMPVLTVAQKRMVLAHFTDPEQVYNSQLPALQKIEGLGSDAIAQLLDKDLRSAQRIYDTCAQHNISFVSWTDSNYPPRLRGLSDAPLILYYKGSLPDFDQRPAIGVVGTRDASPKGLEMARKLGGEVAACGGIVVSGGALGIDTKALQGAYEAGRPTVTLLAGGLDRIYPKENTDFFEKLCTNGCLMSEYPPGTISFKGNFLRRNRLISGISNGVLVVEAPLKSGALNTARWAREQGRDLFVVPDQTGKPENSGTNQLISEDVNAVMSGWAVMQNYAERYKNTVRQQEFVQVQEAFDDQPVKKKTKPVIDTKGIDKTPVSNYSVIEKKLPPLSERERLLVEYLKNGPTLVDIMAAELDMQTAEVMRHLTMLTMKGVVQIAPDGMVSVK